MGKNVCGRVSTRRVIVIGAFVAFALLAPSGAPAPASEAARASTVPSGFVETTVFSGLTNPTVIRFAADGRVFVAEKSGVIKVFSSIQDPTPTLFTDLSTTDGTPNNVLATRVHNFWDRGLLGMALHPNFPTTPYVYVLYTHDAAIGGTAPRWGTAGAVSDSCPNPPGATSDGCVVSGRLSRLQAAGDVMSGSEQVLVEDWCQQYPSHSTGTVDFGPDGALYASAGDGASFNFADYGQDGSPLNPCGDPPGGVGATLTPPTAEGGALRAQDLRTSADQVSLDGSIIRVDATTGAGLPTNPLAASSDPNARRIIAHGLRNPFRFAFRPGTSELWIGDVGWNEYEEINRIPNPSDSVLENFGWPCYEGNPRQPSYDSANLSICENLYASPSADTKPFFAYRHSDKVVPGESCPVGSSSVAGLAFEFAPQVSSYPASYQGALFFADYSRDCIWAMRKNGNPIPSPGSIDTFVAEAANPVYIEFGPDGNLYYADFDGGTIRRVAPDTPPPTGNAYLSDLTWSAMTNGWGPVEKDVSNGEQGQGDGQTLTLNGTTYTKGLGAHAASDVRYPLNASCTRFKASVGMDDEVGAAGSVVFEVYADQAKIYDSGPMTGTSATKAIDVSVAGASELRLAVTDGGDNFYNDHADWALARIECSGGGGGGQVSFAPPQSLPAGTNPHGVTFAQLDSGSTLDLVAANAGSNTLSVWLGNGNGSFGSRSDYATGSQPKQVSAADLNGDGRADLISANQGGASVSVLLANGSGGFGAKVDYPACSGTHESALGHFNADGFLDLVAACWGGSVVSVLIGNGDGSFDPKVDYAVGSAPHSIVVGNFDSDGILDAAAANLSSSSVSVLKGQGNGTFAAKVDYPVGSGPHSIRMGDLDADGRLDLVTANQSSSNVSVLRGLANGTFAAAASYPSGSVPKGVAVADVSGDGRPDVMSANTAGSYPDCCQPGGNTISVLLNTGTGALGSAATFTVGQTPFAVTAGDLDGDGDRDLATANWHSNDVTILLNTTSGGTDTTPPTITQTVPAAGASGVAVGISASATFSEAMNPSTLTASTFTLTKQGTGTPVAASVSYASQVATLDPSVNLDASSTYTATVKGGATGAKDVAGNALAADVSWSFTTAGGGGDTTPPTITQTVPAAGASGVAVGISASATFSEAMNPSTLTASTFTLTKQGTGTPVAASVSYASQVATLDPSVNLDASSTYTATVKGGATGAKDVAGNALAADVSWSFTTDGGQTSSTYLSDLTWTSMTNGFGPVEKDQSNGWNGTGDGRTLTLNGTTYAKGLGAHALSEVRYALGSNCTRFKANVGVDDEVGSNGSVGFEVFAGASTVYSSGPMAGDTPTATVDVSIAGASELRLVVTDGGDNLDYDHADWALARIECGGGGTDTTPPTITQTVPAAGASGVAVGISASATFSEAMNPSTLTASTFTLTKQGTGTPVAASVSYASQVATLDPSVNLDASSTYTATVKGGATGAKDVAGNALAADVSWSFTTAGGGNQPPLPVIDTPASTLTWKVGDQISFTGHATDPEQGTLPASALTWELLLQHCPSNCHQHTLQSWPGVASGSFASPDHEYPSYLELKLTATDAGGSSASSTRRLDPQTVVLSFASSPPGLQLVVNNLSQATPFTRTVIVGSQNSLSATSPQSLGGTSYTFTSWSDAGAQTHNVVAPASAATFTASYAAQSSPPVNTVLPAISGAARVGRPVTVGNGTWTGSQPMTFAYQWLRCTTTALSSCVSILGATSSTYIITSADFDLRLRARVTATNSAGSASATSNATARVR